ncbi:hypothetical protein LCGC14_1359250, partial [marine sediment metagenome]|nr:MAG: hypothetical protein Lokiarch_45080 [Candidatus Lokiarchaeum sp. GC14_75]
MNNKKKHSHEIEVKKSTELNLTDFFKELNNAIHTNDLQSIYQLSKIFTRYHFKKLNN